MPRKPLAPPDPPLSDGVVALRPWRDGDVSGIFEACQDPDLQRFIPVPRPYGYEDAVAYVERTRREWADGTKAAYAVVRADGPDHLLGSVNVAIAGGVGNAGYWVVPSARRQGIATRALRLLTDWAFRDAEIGVMLLEIRPENLGSIGAAEAVGYHEAGTLAVHFERGKEGALLYSRLVSDAAGSDRPGIDASGR